MPGPQKDLPLSSNQNLAGCCLVYDVPNRQNAKPGTFFLLCRCSANDAKVTCGILWALASSRHDFEIQVIAGYPSRYHSQKRLVLGQKHSCCQVQAAETTVAAFAFYRCAQPPKPGTIFLRHAGALQVTKGDQSNLSHPASTSIVGENMLRCHTVVREG